MGFSQHQSFYFREKWLEKVLSFYDSNQSLDKKDLFNSSNYYKLGVGKNMFESIKYWIRAFGIFDKDFNLTPLGNVIKNNDPMLLDKNTLSILHFQLVNSKSEASFWYWFFNEFSGAVLYKESIYLESSLAGWAKVNFKKVSLGSVKKDLLCFLQMYTTYENKEDPEDVLFSPFFRLNLIENNEHSVLKKSSTYEHFGLFSLMYSLLTYSEEKKIKSFTVDDLLNSNGLWGKVFLLDKTNIIKALSELRTSFPKIISFEQSSKLDLITVSSTDRFKLLEKSLGKIYE